MLGLVILFLIILGLIVFYFKFYKKKFSLPYNNITLINGEPGAGKTFLGVSESIKLWKKQCRRWRFRKFFLFKREMKPVLYCNIKLAGVDYCELTPSLILGHENFVPHSVVFWTEASLGADANTYSMDYQKEFVARIKLFRHATKGGYLIVDTQAVKDLNLAIKRCLGSYIWIDRKYKFPFFVILKCRRMMYQDEAVNVVQDIDNETRWKVISKRNFKRYDSYCYYSLFKDIPVVCETIKIPISRSIDLSSSYYWDLSYFTKPKIKGVVINDVSTFVQKALKKI